MDLPTYTNIWRIEKRLYKLYDFRLPAPLPISWIAVFAGITVPYVVLLVAIGLPFNHSLVWLYVLPPGVLTWLTTRPVIENKRLPELLISQIRYLTEPRVWCRLAPLSEQDEIIVVARVWHSNYAPTVSKPGEVVKRGRGFLVRRDSYQARATSGPDTRQAGRLAQPGPAERGPAERSRRSSRLAAAVTGNRPTIAPPLRHARHRVGQGSGLTAGAGLTAETQQGAAAVATGPQGLLQTGAQPEVLVPREQMPHESPQPVPQQPLLEQPVPQDPAVQNLVFQNPVLQNPVVQDPAVQDPVVQAPAADQPVVQEPIGQPVVLRGVVLPDTANLPDNANLPEAAVAEGSAPRDLAPQDDLASQDLASEDLAPQEQQRIRERGYGRSGGRRHVRVEVAHDAVPGSHAAEPDPAAEKLATFLAQKWSPTIRNPEPDAEKTDSDGTPPRATEAPTAPPAQPPAPPAPVIREVTAPVAALKEPAAAQPPPAAPSSLPGRPVPSIERALARPDRAGGPSSEGFGWRRRVKVITGSTQGPGKRDQEALDRDRARLPLINPKRILVLGCTSGAGQTVTALMTGYILASLREHPVAAVDLHDGALARHMHPAARVAALLNGGVPNARPTTALDGLPPGGRNSMEPDAPNGRLDVIASDGTPIGESDIARLAQRLGAHYPIAMLDPGPNGLIRLLAMSDQLVIVVPASVDAAPSLTSTRDWLEAHGFADLATRSVTLVNGVSRRSMTDVEAAESVARGRCRAIVRVPWDDSLPVGAAGPTALLPQTRVAYTALAGVLVAGMAAAPVRVN